MKAFYFLLFFPLVLANTTQCNKTQSTNCYKGRLEIKGICSNYVISVIEGNADTARIEAAWKDPESGKIIKNAFKLNSPCSFPKDINEGDEFYFSFTDKADKDCAVCMAYRPVPAKKNMIAVSKTPCN